MKIGYWYRFILGALAAMALLGVFVTQQFNFAKIFTESPQYWFFINRTIRFIANDFFALLLLFSFFPQRNKLLFAMVVQIFGVLFFLLPYFILKYYFPNDNGPLLNFLHRLILNPVLILLLIPAFYYQQTKQENR